jgi:hypothetical protein
MTQSNSFLDAFISPYRAWEQSWSFGKIQFIVHLQSSDRPQLIRNLMLFIWSWIKDTWWLRVMALTLRSMWLLRLCNLKSHRSLRLRHYRAAFLLLTLRNFTWTSQWPVFESSTLRVFSLNTRSVHCHLLRFLGIFVRIRRLSSGPKILPSLNRLLYHHLLISFPITQSI